MINELALAAGLACGGGVDAVRALASHRPAPDGPTVLERMILEARADPALEGLRAGAPVAPANAPAADERAALDRAQRSTQDLERQRAGDLELSDRELTIIAITAAAVLLLVLLF